MSRPFVALPVLGLLVAAGFLGAHCNSTTPATAGPLGAKPTEGAAAPGESPNDGLTEAETAKLLPGIDTSMLTPRQRADLSELASDTFCPCASTTVATCLRQQPTCRAAVRMTELAKQMFIDGQTPAGALLRTESYYGSFPKERRREIPGTGPTKGGQNARVHIQEFSDFQCPACRAAHPQLGEVAHKYPADVKVTFRHFPLPRHDFARQAALAAAFAADQNKFWPMADRLFDRQDSLSLETIAAIAKEISIDAGEMNKATTDDPKYLAKIEEDLKTGNDLQVNATPTLYVNGRQHILPATLKYLSWTVEDELEWISNGGTWKK